jgi:hypothetical protein
LGRGKALAHGDRDAPLSSTTFLPRPRPHKTSALVNFPCVSIRPPSQIVRLPGRTCIRPRRDHRGPLYAAGRPSAATPTLADRAASPATIGLPGIVRRGVPEPLHRCAGVDPFAALRWPRYRRGAVAVGGSESGGEFVSRPNTIGRSGAETGRTRRERGGAKRGRTRVRKSQRGRAGCSP